MIWKYIGENESNWRRKIGNKEWRCSGINNGGAIPRSCSLHNLIYPPTTQPFPFFPSPPYTITLPAPFQPFLPFAEQTNGAALKSHSTAVPSSTACAPVMRLSSVLVSMTTVCLPKCALHYTVPHHNYAPLRPFHKPSYGRATWGGTMPPTSTWLTLEILCKPTVWSSLWLTTMSPLGKPLYNHWSPS